ncbi:transposase [Escherichia coli]|uniref:integrase core domain-containing protein n=1 Tax=Escherichia coli TaxID=562 RepID=UPI001929E1CE|nr:integrase core domain-containing protein [Escherichia coli]MBL3985726.1 transposase [Escherichia coli]
MIDVLGPEKRRRRTTQEKIAIVQQSFEPGMTVSLVARQHGVAASQLFLWRKQYQEGSLTAVAAGEQVVPTRQFARMLGLEPKNTAVRSPESNGIAESFVKTIKRDYISIMPKPDGLTAAKNLAEAFEHYNEWHPHSALGYRSPREYLRQRACNGLSDNRCLEI